MQRYQHYWWPLKGKACPGRVAVLDCDPRPVTSETDNASAIDAWPVWHVQSLACRRRKPDATNEACGTGLTSLWSTLSAMLEQQGKLWLFVPDSGWLLDTIGLWERLERGEIYLDGWDRRTIAPPSARKGDVGGGLCIIEDPPTLILCRLTGRQGKLLILDVRNWGIELLGGSGSCHERSAAYLSGIRDCLHTLRNDCECSVRGTAAAQAVSALRTQHDCVRLHCHTNWPVLELERRALHGGRCECFRLGKLLGPVYHLDVRSMYPALCLELAVPVSLRRYHADGLAAHRIVDSKGENCCASVRLRCDRPGYPSRRGDITIYPTGEFNATLCGPELCNARSNGSIVRVHAAAEYTTAPYLSGFYREWLRRLATARAAGRTMECQWIKRTMNALPGKFAEPGRQWHPHPPLPGTGPYGRFGGIDPKGRECRMRNIAYNTQWEEVADESYWSIPAIAGWITSAGRVRLWDYIETARRENVWYVDTDALLCNQTGYDRLLHAGYIREGATGYLRLLGCYSRGFIYGIRHYQLGDTVTCAGVPVGEILPGETRAGWWRRQRITEQVSMGHRPTGRVINVPLPTELDYRHGQVLADGSVIPWEVNDEW